MSTVQYQFVDFVLSDGHAGKQYSSIEDDWDEGHDDTMFLINEALKVPDSGGSSAGSSGRGGTSRPRSGSPSSSASACDRHAL